MTDLRPQDLIPHRPPMLLLDRILSVGEREILAETRIDPDAFFLRGHYPGFPLVPGVITCECLFQAGAALIARRLGGADPDRVPVVARIEKARFRRPIRPGEVVRLKVELKDEAGGAWFLRGEARVADALAATVEFACLAAPREAMG